MELTAAFMKVPGGHDAFVEALPAANTHGATLDEARENLPEAVALVIGVNRGLSERSIAGRAWQVCRDLQIPER